MDVINTVSYGQTPENEILLKRKLEKLSGLETLARAEDGDPVAQFVIYKQKKAPNEESLRWLCLSAHWGHPPAQEELGDLFLPGRDDNREIARLVQPDDVTAYIWYSIADLNGLNRALIFRDDLSNEMTDKKVAEAERLVAQWKPNPAECETITARAAN